jgi:adenylate cyclase
MSPTCGACGRLNREGLRFCTHCGGALTVACPACGEPAEPGERFCGHCGAPLTLPARRARLSPGTLAVSAEKKHITVLFADVAGSMDLQERLDAEVWAQIMGPFVSILAEGVRKYGGTVDKFTGDGIMALFGAPVAQEDHARRACHAAWQLTKAIGAYSEELRRTHDVDLQVRLGLNSGEVVVGRVGEDVTLDPTALGHTVGLAQRMEAMAEPGTAYLTEHTARLVESWFHLEDLGGHSVKGTSAPLKVHVLGAPLRSPSRRSAAAPLVGRSRELAVLEDALDMAAEGQFQVVGVVGEAGVGKSRLCDELAELAHGRGLTVRRASGVSHGREVPLLPILSFQREYFGISDSDDPAAARRKVTDRLLDLDPELEDTLPLLFDFLEVPDPQRPVGPMTPEVRMRRILDAVRRITARRSERETLVLVIEDLHWFDPQSEAFLERLIESYPGSRTLVVANFRPEFSARWMRHSYYRQLPLAPLREQGIGELLGGLLGIDLSLAPLVSFILERTSGNPFFVEEVVRDLIEDGTLAGRPGDYRLTRPLHELRVPASVQAVLAARIDRLTADQKAVLQTASVIGRTFDAGLLGQVVGSSKDSLDEALSALCAAELLQETTPAAAEAYRFWHPLTQEVAYGSLLGDRRRGLHGAVAEALMTNAGDRLDELAAVLAWHWQQGGQPLEAARWNMRAGGWALRSDLGEAQRRWRTAVDLLTGVDDSPEALQLGVQARNRLVQFGARTGIAPEESERLFREARAFAERLDDPALVATTVFLSASPMVLIGDWRAARSRYSEAIRLAEAVGDPELLAAVCMALTVVSIHTGPLTDGLQWTERIQTLCEGNVDHGVSVVGYSILVRTLQFQAWLLSLSGSLTDAEVALRRSLRLARPRAEPDNLAWTLSSFPQLGWLTGSGDDVVAAASEAVAFCEDTGNASSLVLALERLALAELAVGNPAKAIAACERGLAEARRHRSGRFAEASVLAHLARARLVGGDVDEALSNADEAVTLSRTQCARVVECLALVTRAQARRATGRPGEAESDLASALVLVGETGAVTYEPFIREELGRLHDDEKELTEALRLYRQIGATGHARRLESERSMEATR